MRRSPRELDSRRARGSECALPRSPASGSPRAPDGRRDPGPPRRRPGRDLAASRGRADLLRRHPRQRSSGGSRSCPLFARRSRRPGVPKAVVVRLHGPSGVGKTALVRRFLEQARRADVVVLSGRCYERETVPYKALDSLVDALSQYLKRLPPEEAEDALATRHSGAGEGLSGSAPGRGHRLLSKAGAGDSGLPGAAAASLLCPPRALRPARGAARRRALPRRLQWGDVDSATLLGDLLRPPDPPPLLLIASYRATPRQASPFLNRLDVSEEGAEALDVRELRIEELSESESRDLARTLLEADLPAPSADTEGAEVEALARESRGNPLFLSELVRYRQAGVELTDRDRREILGGRDPALGNAGRAHPRARSAVARSGTATARDPRRSRPAAASVGRPARRGAPRRGVRRRAPAEEASDPQPRDAGRQRDRALP